MWVFTSLNPIDPVMSGNKMPKQRQNPLHQDKQTKPERSGVNLNHPKFPVGNKNDRGPFKSGHVMPKPKPIPIHKNNQTKLERSGDHPKFHGGNKNAGPFKSVSMMPKLKPTPIPQFKNHNEQVCSTWGYYHFNMFDGDMYHYPGKCQYVFASHCKGSPEDFNILFRRTEEDGVPVISYILLKIHEVMIEIINDSLTLDGDRVTKIPVDKSRVLIDRIGKNLKITYSSDIYFVWNGEDSMLLKLNRKKYGNQTCGMCGDFNGIQGLTFDGIEVTAVQFGNMQKRNEPTEDCPNVSPPTSTECTDKEERCETILTSEAFSNCSMLLNPTVYIDICVQDLCRCSSKDQMSCLCSIFAEYSHQCTHAGGVPDNWRTPSLCPITCPLNMVYQEYGSPCLNTCSNTERSMVCEDHNIDGCFCPEDTVLDDINNTGCIPQENCFCVYDANNYSPGSSYSTSCQACTCFKGKWKCNALPCTSSCSVEGGSHITTFDGSRYSTNGDCSYVLAKHSTGHDFVLLGELRRCEISTSKSCLKGLILVLNRGEIVVSVKENCVAFLNWMNLQLPVSVANMTISQPTSFYMNIHTMFGLSVMIQCIPIMQVYIDVDSSYEHQTCGLCGNFNNIQADDFKALSGVIEGTAAAFVNTWKTLANCPNIKNSYVDPCSLNVEKEKYAMHWCGLLTSATGPFSSCHSLESPLIYHANCMSDTCSCTDSEECMCAALSSYAFACAKKEVFVTGWRDTVCKKYMQACKESQVYRYHVNQSQPICRSLSEADSTRKTKLVPVDGCVCRDGTYMNDNGDCVEASSCPCYYQSNVIQSGEMIEENGVACTCDKGQLNCMGSVIKVQACTHPLINLNCTTAPMGSKGVECQKSCDTLDMDCYSSQCISGCVCPKGLVSDGKRGCISEDQCPCIHNEAQYRPGATISVACNTCTCKNRKWQCTHEQCLGSCSVYGNGHHTSFDNKHFTFSGTCEYTLVQDNCGEAIGQSSVRVIMQNVQCGFNGTICSKTIKIFLGGEELRLDNEKIEVVKREEKNRVQYEIIRRGLYLILKTINGHFIMWDTKAAIQIKLRSDFKGKVCGICGNYDGNAKNDFTTRSHSVVENLMEFYNSWKTDPKCPDVYDVKNPCSINPYRKAWATKQCAIITSNVFQPCHSQVDPTIYYDSCISDSCSCDAGGDCECFCTAVAAYAQACSENGVCIRWRTPNICPMFCDYYNDAGECAWHYKPCGDKCMKTCRNPKGECLYELSGLEGCYPHCPASKPYLNEDIMKCVFHCGCDDGNGNFYNYGEKVPAKENCHSCECSMKGISCQYDVTACRCKHDGKMYNYSEIIPSINDTDGVCKKITCDVNGTIVTLTNLCTAAVITTTPNSKPQKNNTPPHHHLSLSKAPITSASSFSTTSNPTSTSFSATTEITSTASTVTEPFSSTPKFPISSSSLAQSILHTSSETTSGGSKSSFTTTSNPTSTSFSAITKITPTAYTFAEPFSSTPKFLISSSSLAQSTLPTSSETANRGSTSSFTTSSNPTSTSFSATTKFTSAASTVTEPFSSTPKFPISSPRVAQSSNPTSTSFSATTKITSTASTVREPFFFAPKFPISSSRVAQSSNPTSTSYAATTKITSTASTVTEPSSSTPNFPLSSSKPSTPSSTLTTVIRTKPSSLSPTSTISPTTSCSYCNWTEWHNDNHPTSRANSGDRESIEIVKAKGKSACSNKSYVQDVACEASAYSNIKFQDLRQNATCSVESGLICNNKDNSGPRNMCLDYKIRFYCCEKCECSSHTTTTATSPSKSMSFTSMSLYSSIRPTKQPLTTLTTISTSGRSTSTRPDEICVYGGSVYKVGSSIPQPSGSCQNCKCTATITNSAVITCEPIVCNTDCKMGYSYKERDGQCCGTCVREFCVLNKTVPIKPGNLWYPPGDNCTSYGCEPDTFIVVKRVMSCPHQKPIKCDKGILVNFTSSDRCCTIQFCEPRRCDVMKSWKLIESGGCRANVTLTNCGGYCSSISRHPNFPKMKGHDCTCCQATKTTTKEIQLDCNNGRNIGYTFTDVLQCSCRSAACVFTE